MSASPDEPLDLGEEPTQPGVFPLHDAHPPQTVVTRVTIDHGPMVARLHINTVLAVIAIVLAAVALLVALGLGVAWWAVKS